MDRNRKLLKNTIIYFIGTFGSKILVFFLLPLYSKYLSTDQFGTVNLVTNLVPLIGPIFTLQVTETIFRFMCTAKNEQEKKEYISNSFFLFLFGIGIFIICYIPIVLVTKFEYTVLFALYFIFNYLALYLQQVLRGLQKNLDYSITGIISTITQLLINIIFITKIHERSILLATFAGSVIVIIYILLRIKFFKFINLKLVSKKIIKEMLKYSVPLIPNQVSWWLNGIAGIYILEYFVGTDATGIISFANKFPTLLATINGIFLLAWTENSIYEYSSSDKSEYYSKNLQFFTIFVIMISAFLLPAIKVYYGICIDEKFLSSLQYIPLMFVSMIFNASATFQGSVYTASMKTKDAFSTTIIAAVVNVICSIILIPILKIYGFILSNVISYFVFYSVRKISVNKIVKLKENYIIYIFPFIFFIVSWIVYEKFNYIINFIYDIVAFIIILIIFRKKIKQVALKIIKK